MSKSLSVSQATYPMKSLDVLLAAIPGQIIQNEAVNIEMTNRAIIEYASKNRLRPVRAWEYALYYRVVTRTPQGILKIGYTTEPPGYIEPLYGAEKILVKWASKAYGISKEEIMRMFPDRNFTSANARLNLSEFNSRIRSHQGSQRVP